MLPSNPLLQAPPQPRWVKWVKWAALVLGVFTAVILFAVVKTLRTVAPGVSLTQVKDVITDVVQPHPEKKAFGDRNTLNILVLGVDYDYTDSDVPFSKNARSDTIFVLQVRRDGNYVGMLSMPRDMYVEYPDGGHDKVNAAYSRGGVKLEKDMLKGFLGIDFDYYAVIRINAAQRIIDRLGGIDVNVEKDMNYDDNWGHLHVHLKKGAQHLNGEQAVGFARFRHDEDGDRGRMRRQQVFMSALLDKVKSVTTSSDAFAFLGEVAKIAHESLETDMSVDTLVSLGMVYKGFNRHNLRTAQLDGADTTIDQAAVIIPPEPDKVAKVVHSVIRGDSAEPSVVDVEILNGSRDSEAGRTVEKELSSKGFKVIYVGGAKAAEHSEVIDYSLEDAQRSQLMSRLAPYIQGTLAAVTPVEAGPEWQSNPNQTDVTIILGADYKAPITPSSSPRPR